MFGLMNSLHAAERYVETSACASLAAEQPSALTPTDKPRAIGSMDKDTALLYIFEYNQGAFRMDAISYSAARANLASTMDRVCEDHEPLIITRNGQQSVVMLSLEDFTALEETAYLLRSPANAKRLLASMEQLNGGRGTERKLAE